MAVTEIASAASLLSMGAASTESVLEDAYQTAVNKWLATADLPGGRGIHISSMLAVQSVSAIQAPLAGVKSKANNAASLWESIFTMDPEVAANMNDIFTMFQQPSIEGIAIFTAKEHQTGTLDVSQNPLIVQQDKPSTMYVCDNAVPHPREWSIQGYLTTILPTDHYLVVKPSIQMQRNYLDACRLSRRPVWFKTYDQRFYRVLISSFESDWEPNAMNALSVSLRLVEYVPFVVDTLRGPVKDAIKSAALVVGR